MPTKKPIYTFLALVVLLAGFSYVGMFIVGENAPSFDLWLLFLQFTPMVAAFIVRFASQKNLRGLGWGWGKWRYQIVSWILPFFIGLITFSLVWVLGFGDLAIAPAVEEARDGMREIFGAALTSDTGTLLSIIALNATLGLLISSPAIGEELGWRGFLAPELFKHYSFTKTCFISGIIWAVYHFPLVIFLIAPRLEISAWPMLISITLGATALGFILTWLRLKSGSVWTAVIFHAALNIHNQGFFHNLTAKNSSLTHYISGEYGLMLGLVASAFAVWFWRRRGQLTPESRAK